MTIEPTGLRVGDPDVYTLHNAGNGSSAPHFSEDPAALVTGHSSGFQALNLGVLAGAARHVLLGYDMKVAADGRTNYHKEHARSTPRGHYEIYRAPFRRLPAILARLGVEVLNATPGSALEVFPRGALESVLPDPVAAVLPA